MDQRELPTVQPLPADAVALEDAEARPTLYIPFVMSASIGGGIFGFTDDSTNDFTDPIGGAWEARFAFGIRRRISLEAAYVGGAVGLDTLGVEGGATLIATTIEADIRLNAMTDFPLQVYALAGVGWRRYDLVNTDFNTSSVRDHDNVVAFPLGLGVAYRYRGFVIDGRGVYRPSIDNDLIGFTSEEQDDNPLDTLELILLLGWEI